jgi:hypothetical protein
LLGDEQGIQADAAVEEFGKVELDLGSSGGQAGTQRPVGAVKGGVFNQHGRPPAEPGAGELHLKSALAEVIQQVLFQEIGQADEVEISHGRHRQKNGEQERDASPAQDRAQTAAGPALEEGGCGHRATGAGGTTAEWPGN